MDFFALWYVYPFFQQGWILFIPPPECNYYLYARLEDGSYEDIFNDVLSRHQANRLAGQEPLLLALTGSIHYFEKGSPMQDEVNEPVKNDLNFTIMAHAAKNYLQHKKGKKITNLKLVLVVEQVGSGKQRVYKN